MSILNNNNNNMSVRPRLVTVGRGRSINPQTTDFRTDEVELEVDNRKFTRNNNQCNNATNLNTRGENKRNRGLSEDEGAEERILKLKGELAIAR